MNLQSEIILHIFLIDIKPGTKRLWLFSYNRLVPWSPTSYKSAPKFLEKKTNHGKKSVTTDSRFVNNEDCHKI